MIFVFDTQNSHSSIIIPFLCVVAEKIYPKTMPKVLFCGYRYDEELNSFSKVSSAWSNENSSKPRLFCIMHASRPKQRCSLNIWTQPRSRREFLTSFFGGAGTTMIIHSFFRSREIFRETWPPREGNAASARGSIPTAAHAASFRVAKTRLRVIVSWFFFEKKKFYATNAPWSITWGGGGGWWNWKTFVSGANNLSSHPR